MSLSLEKIIELAFQEDLPEGDLTTDSLKVSSQLGRARLMAKEDLVVSGQQIFESCLRFLDPDMQILWHFKDGDWALEGQCLAQLKGDLVRLLKSERTALNFMGRFSGIATFTHCFVEKIRGYPCQILDTRKTTPLLRSFEKRAVEHGGGANHRMNLSAAVLLKENHQRMVGGMKAAVTAIRRDFQGPIEVECAELDEVRQAVALGVERVLLDNMSPGQIREALALLPSHVQSEASGNINLDNVREYAATGVQFISIGALTHSAPCADLSLLFEWS